jgi:hypothetical protein
LRLGSASQNARGNEDNNILTQSGFKTVLSALKTMPKLVVLYMQLPDVKELDVHAMGTR